MLIISSSEYVVYYTHIPALHILTTQDSLPISDYSDLMSLAEVSTVEIIFTSFNSCVDSIHNCITRSQG